MPPLFANGVEVTEVWVDGVQQESVWADGVEVFTSADPNELVVTQGIGFENDGDEAHGYYRGVANMSPLGDLNPNTWEGYTVGALYYEVDTGVFNLGVVGSWSQNQFQSVTPEGSPELLLADAFVLYDANDNMTFWFWFSQPIPPVWNGVGDVTVLFTL